MTPRFARTLTAAVVAGTLSSAALAQDKIRFAGNFELQHPSSVAMEKVFKPELAKRTNNQLQVDLFPAMQLGGAKENVDGVRAGTLLMTWVGAAYLSRIVQELEAVSLPFVFPNREVAFKVMDGEVGVLLDKKLAEKNFISLGWMDLGQRQFTNSKRPIKSIDDFKGLKVRLQPNETHLATFRALGANAVAMDVKELYSALEQKVMDGQENPYTIIRAARYTEVQKYVSNTGHFYDFIAIIANRKQFDALKPEYQKAIRESIAAAVAYQRKLAVETDREAFDDIRKKMQYDEIPPQVREQMRKATAPVIDQVKKRAGADLVDRVVAESAKASK
jgi:tripartite ATP-independent transporter DctP family solute receptor